MQEDNLNTSSVGSGLSEYDEVSSDINNFRTPLVSCSTDRNHRSRGPMTLGHIHSTARQKTQETFQNILNGFNPVMENTFEPLRGNLSPWSKKQSNSESFIINVDNMNHPNLQPIIDSNMNTQMRSPSAQHNIEYTLVPIGSTNSNHSLNQLQDSNANTATRNSNNNNHSSNSVNNESFIGTNNSSGNDNSTTTPLSEREPGFQENLNSNPEMQAVDKLIYKYLPFITFLLIKALYDHRGGIFIFVGLLVTFAHANSVVKREIAKRSHRSLLSLSILFVNLFVCICFIYFVFREQRLYKCLLFIPPYWQPLSIWDLLWMVGITDFVLKFITIQIKAGMACFPAKLLPYSARGKWYLMLECISQLYRGLAPIQPWLYYLMEAYQGPEKVVGVFFSVAYMVSKGTELLSKVKLFLRAFWKLIQNVSLGVHPSKEELDIAGSQCPICHDEFNTPVQLHCKHVFCEGCVSTWFDREQTCPLCRMKIVDDPSWRDGATSFFAQLF